MILINTHKCFDQDKNIGYRCHIHAQCLDKESYARLYEKSVKTNEITFGRVVHNKDW